MTTSHRAQLEARSGSKSTSYIPTGTQHARLLPGHTTLKFRKGRQDNDNTGGRIQPDEGKALEYEEAQETFGVFGAGTSESENEEAGVAKHASEEEQVSEEEYGSDDEQESLLQELNKIRRERMLKKIRKEQCDEDDGKTPAICNVLAIPQGESGWRSTSTFGRNRVTKASGKDKKAAEKLPKGYSNDLSKSEYHQDFLRRFVK